MSLTSFQFAVWTLVLSLSPLLPYCVAAPAPQGDEYSQYRDLSQLAFYLTASTIVPEW